MKMTKEDIDKVRDIEGFPDAKDEDIIALSNPPYYTACPNPFISDFIENIGSKFDENTDNYHREPFSADVSEGKNDPFYMAHGYHTKVPHKAIMRYILHYTNPEDLVLDGFCGTGMTAVAALECGNIDHIFYEHLKKEIGEFKCGKRNAIVSDISPIASFIAGNYTNEIDMTKFLNMISLIIDNLKNKFGWMYETKAYSDINNCQKGIINYTVWSDVYICSSCSKEYVYWDVSIDEDMLNEKNEKICPHCDMKIDKKNIIRAYELKEDAKSGKTYKQVKQVPVMIKYTIGSSQFKKKPDANDIELISKIENEANQSWYPQNNIPMGDKTSEPLNKFIDRVDKFYTSRNLFILSKFYEEFDKIPEIRYKNFAKFVFSSIYSRSHKMNRYMPNYNRHVGPLSGTLYFPFFMAEINIFNLVSDKLDAIVRIGDINENAITSIQSATDLKNITDNSIDYIFTDPPFGDNIMYSELNFVNECWNKVLTNNQSEAIMNKTQRKKLFEYQELMTRAFCEYFRVLKPGRWITVEFHNSKNSVWNAIQEAISVAGFVVADVRTLDKQKGTTNQLSYGYAVKQDLVITAYKPREKFVKEMYNKNGSEETAWEFVHQHLGNLPVVVIRNSKIEIIAERQAYLLFDRMVAYHIMHGLSVPVDASQFYRELDKRFLMRDDMYYLVDQVNEYDTARIINDVEPIQYELFVTNEKTAIAWLYQQLEVPQTYSELQPQFMQEVKKIDKFEKIPELSSLLEENFIQDEKANWYIPDLSKNSDIIKLREKKLLKEFESYLNSKGKLKLFRTEAIRVGFANLWSEKKYNLIIEVAERLPESVIQEDDKLLMYYDISLGRI